MRSQEVCLSLSDAIRYFDNFYAHFFGYLKFLIRKLRSSSL